MTYVLQSVLLDRYGIGSKVEKLTQKKCQSKLISLGENPKILVLNHPLSREYKNLISGNNVIQVFSD